MYRQQKVKNNFSHNKENKYHHDDSLFTFT